jgi:hypothetical protein
VQIEYPVQQFNMFSLSHCITLVLFNIIGVLSQNAASYPSISTFYQFPKIGTADIESIAVRSDGSVFITRTDVPELWSIDPLGRDATLVHTFPIVASLGGIVEVRKDIFAIAGFNYTFGDNVVAPGSAHIFVADFSKVQPKYTTFPIAKSSLPDCIATWNSEQGIVLFGDNALGQIFKFDIDTGAYSVVSDDAALKPAPGAFPPFGVNGIKVGGQYVYFTSSTKSLFGRIPLREDASPAGPVEIIAETDTIVDDFVLGRDGTAYISSTWNSTIIRIGSDGKVSNFVQGIEVSGATTVMWASVFDETTLYVGTSGSTGAPVGFDAEPAHVVKLEI